VSRTFAAFWFQNEQSFSVPANSSLIENYLETGVCITYNRSNILTVSTCNSNDPSQQWIRTRYKQLLHVKTLKCIQLGEEYSGSNNNFWHVGLEDCNTSETRQQWDCHDRHLRSVHSASLYLSYNTTVTDKIIRAKHPHPTHWILTKICSSCMFLSKSEHSK
jgi:hypothetical protein